MRNQKEEIQNKTNVSIQFSENLAFIRLRVGTLEVVYKLRSCRGVHVSRLEFLKHKPDFHSKVQRFCRVLNKNIIQQRVRYKKRKNSFQWLLEFFITVLININFREWVMFGGGGGGKRKKSIAINFTLSGPYIKNNTFSGKEYCSGRKNGAALKYRNLFIFLYADWIRRKPRKDVIMKPGIECKAELI